MIHTTKEIDGYALPYLLYLDNSNVMKSNHWLLQLHTLENEPGLTLADSFATECRLHLPKFLNWFHQGGCLPSQQRSPWHMFEFWSHDEIKILQSCMDVAESLGLRLQLEALSREDLNFINGEKTS